MTWKDFILFFWQGEVEEVKKKKHFINPEVNRKKKLKHLLLKGVGYRVLTVTEVLLPTHFKLGHYPFAK